MNTVFLIGKLTKDPVELKGFKARMTEIELAIPCKGKPNNPDIVPITYYRKKASDVELYLKEGTTVVVSAKVSSTEVTSPNGRKRRFTKVVSDEIFTASQLNFPEQYLERLNSHQERIAE